MIVYYKNKENNIIFIKILCVLYIIYNIYDIISININIITINNIS